jgi:hypothetical protein
MKIIYHCYGGSHSSVLAAALHLKMLDPARPPAFEDMMLLPYFDKTRNIDFGTIRHMGTDDLGHEVYVLGKKNMGDRCTAMIMSVARLLGVEHEVIAVNCMSRVNLFMMIGGFISRRLGWTTIGRPILFRGTRDAFRNIANLVEITRLKTMQ